MKSVNKFMIYSTVNNFIISVIKVFGGVAFKLDSLIADGIHTFSNFVTDLVSLIGGKIFKDKPDKYNPFGYNKFANWANIVVAFVIFILGGVAILNSFKVRRTIPSYQIFIFIFIALIMKMIAYSYLKKCNNKNKSQSYVNTYKELKLDIYTTILVIVVVIILQASNSNPMLKNADFLGSVLIGLLILSRSFSIFIDNILSMRAKLIKNENLSNKIQKFVLNFNEIKNCDVFLLKCKKYYKLRLSISLDKNISLKEQVLLERKIKKEIFNQNFNVNYVNIMIVNTLK